MNAEPADALVVPGEQLERYEVLRTLGTGGMAQVVLVRHTALGTLHALKVLTLAGPGLADRMLAEGRVQAQLRHPNVVAVSDVLTVKGMPALVLEYVDGPDLDRWIREARPGPDEAERLFRGIVAGVAAAHDAGHIHRDLKPANVLLATGDDGLPVPRIADFGLVKAIQADTAGKTRTGMPLGTPQYMAPEQIRSAADVDQRADIWSLGCILYELVAHAQAYPGEDLVDVWERASQRRREPVPEGTPAHLVTTIDRCLQPDPDRRPADCAEVLALLDDRTPRVEHVGAIDPTDEWIARARRGRGPSRALLAVLAAFGSVVVVVGVTGVVLAAVLAGQTWPAPCPTTPGLIGHARAPWVFDKPVGSVWRLSEATPVRTLAAPNTVGAVCVLAAGTRVRVAEPVLEHDGERWVPIHGDQVELGALTDPEVPGEQEGIVGRRCEGTDGARIGWLLARPKALGPRPRPGGTWEPSGAVAVHATPPTKERPPGPQVCALRAGTAVDVVGEPVQARPRGFWVPVTAGRIREPVTVEAE